MAARDLNQTAMRYFMTSTPEQSTSRRIALRTALCGIFAMLAVCCFVNVSVGQGSEEIRQAAVEGKRKTEQPARIVISSMKPRAGGRSTAVDRYGLLRSDYLQILANIPPVQKIAPVRVVSRRVRNGRFSTSVNLIGTTPAYAGIDGLRVIRGRFLSQRDMKSFNNVAVIDSSTAEKVFLGTKAVGKYIRAGKTYYLVIGVLAQQNARSETLQKVRSSRVYIPISTMRVRDGDLKIDVSIPGIFSSEVIELDRIEITVQGAENLLKTVSVIRQLLQRLHKNKDYKIRISK
ncbi:MAG: ABC transporter permease [Planctomycetes bacterium]|nr:ABC transporter permease [Planctomycetota bacterium]